MNSLGQHNDEELAPKSLHGTKLLLWKDEGSFKSFGKSVCYMSQAGEDSAFKDTWRQIP
jgi:hypothetical protein